MSEYSNDKVQESQHVNQIHLQNLPANHIIQTSQQESRCHVLLYDQRNGVPQTFETRGGRGYTIVQLGQYFNLQLDNQQNSNTIILDNSDIITNPESLVQLSKNYNIHQDQITSATELNKHNQIVKNQRIVNSVSSCETKILANGNQTAMCNSTFLKQSADTISNNLDNHLIKTSPFSLGSHISVTSSQKFVSPSFNPAGNLYAKTANLCSSSDNLTTSAAYVRFQSSSLATQNHDYQSRVSHHKTSQSYVITTTTTNYPMRVSDLQPVCNSKLYGDKQALHSTAQYIISQIPNSTASDFQENQFGEDNIQNFTEHSLQFEQNEQFPPLARSLSSREITKYQDIQKLASLTGTPLYQRMSPSVPQVATQLGSVQLGSFLSYQTKHMNFTYQTPCESHPCGNTSVNNKAPVKLPAEFCCLNEKYKCPNPNNLEKETRRQTSSTLWFNERKNRITASSFGKILLRKSQPNEKFLSSIFSHSSFHTESIDYGKRHEKVAKETYLMKFPSRHLHECGLVINNEYSFLGASPDGKLCDQGKFGIVEIKCPFSARNLDLSQAYEELRDFCLQKDENGNIFLKKDHMYYYQIQGQLLVTGCNFCEFILYTQKELHVERILPNVTFMESMLLKLAMFFRDFGLPFLSKA